MSEVEIVTPRGVTLRGTFVNPADSDGAAVLFSHSFLCDRQSSPHFPRLAAKYRDLGYATMIFDYSGHGESDDDPITSDRRVEDLRAVSGWLEDMGFGRQLLHAHSSGSVSALLSRPKAVDAMFLSSPIMGPMDFDWQRIFSPEQLEDLEKKQEVRVYEDTLSGRQYFQVTPQTLIDLSLNTPEKLLEQLDQPVAIVFDKVDAERGVDGDAEEMLSMLPNGSELCLESERDFSSEADLPILWEHAKSWALEHVPPRTA